MDTTTPTDLNRLVTVRQAAVLRGVYVRRLWAAIRDGSLPAYQIGGWLRVRLADVDEWIETMRLSTEDATD